MSDLVKAYWAKFLATQPAAFHSTPYTAWSFGNTPAMADELGDLVVRGIKRATTSLAWIYEKFPEEKIPQVGEYSVVLNSEQRPLCIIQTVSVVRKKYSAVDAEFAATEGEGDGSLRYWQEVHWKYFVGECQLCEREACPDMPVLCEIFKVVYV